MTISRIKQMWRCALIGVFGLLLFIIWPPSVAEAHNCGSFWDCYDTLRAALSATVGLSMFAVMLSMGLDFVPVVGQGKGLIEAITGRDLITGQELNEYERILGIVGPAGALAGGAFALGRGLRNTDNIADAGSAARTRPGNTGTGSPPAGRPRDTDVSGQTGRQADSGTGTGSTGRQADSGTGTGSTGRGGQTDTGGSTPAGKTNVDNPFNEAGKLKPNVKYKAGEHRYDYETDHLGRLEKFSADDLKLTTRSERLPHDSNTPGKKPGDHAGHLAGDRFGGSPELDNLVSQSSNVNLSQYKKIENQWANAIRDGKQVKVNVEVKYDGDRLRPSKFNVQYEIDGEAFSKILLN